MGRLWALIRDKVVIITQHINMKYISLSIFILILFQACDNVERIEPYTRMQVKEFVDLDSLNSLEYLKLCSSVELLDSIFEDDDTSVRILKDAILIDYNRPIVFVNGNKDFRNWIGRSELDSLNSLLGSKQKCLPITNSLAAYPANYLSTIGQESEFLLRLYQGDILMNSQGRY